MNDQKQRKQQLKNGIIAETEQNGNRHNINGYPNGQMPHNPHGRKPRKKKRSRGARIFTTVLIVLLVAVLAVVAFVAKSILTKPKQPQQIPFDVPETVVGGNECNSVIKEGTYNFLILGKDRVALNTDVFMIASFNVDTDQITVVQIPRDTYTKVDGRGYKINALYGHFYNAAQQNGDKNPTDTAMKQLSGMLEQSLNVKLHYYALVDLSSFVNIVDIIGGVELEVPANMDYDDDSQNLHIHLKKGYQTLNGDKAEQFVRFRSGYVQADIGRMDAQKIFMGALLKKIKASFNVETIVGISKQCIKYVNTSVGLDECIFFAKQLMEVDMDKIQFISLPGEAIKENGAWYYVMYKNSARNIINNYLNIYTFEITDAMFDKERIYTSGNGTDIDSIYKKVVDVKDPVTADGATSGEITIPRL